VVPDTHLAASLLYERTRGWTQVGDLLPGEEVFTSRGGWARIGAGTWLDQEQLLYDLEVEGAHTYFVGETGAWAHNCLGRAGRQARLRALVDDENLGAELRGWIRQELNAIERGTRSTIRVPPGYQLAHRRGFEARLGYSYEHSDLQTRELHVLQHHWEGY
jgi:hypothetical protein